MTNNLDSGNLNNNTYFSPPGGWHQMKMFRYKDSTLQDKI